MEIDEHTAHIHIPTVEEIAEQVEKEMDSEITRIVKEILKDRG